jgi:hypothetical protein
VAFALIAPVGCGPTTLERQNASLVEYKSRMDAATQRYIETSREIEQQFEECLAAMRGLVIGRATLLDTLSLPCKPDHINTTETGRSTNDQVIYEWPYGDGVAYLYFENGILKAKQQL